jgi:CheY-like chemotaxis protein
VRVLIVDDSPDARRLVRTVATGLGYEVVGESANGRSAVVAAIALDPDVVIMDWDMPVMDGVAATAAIRSRRPEIEVVAYSSDRDPAVAARFLKAGAVSYVHKGDTRSLVAVLRDRIAASRREGAVE